MIRILVSYNFHTLIWSKTTSIYAKNWFDEERIDWITNRYSKPDLKFYENPVTVDNNSDEIIS